MTAGLPHPVASWDLQLFASKKDFGADCAPRRRQTLAAEQAQNLSDIAKRGSRPHVRDGSCSGSVGKESG